MCIRDRYSSLAKVTENYSDAKALYDELTIYVDYVNNGVGEKAKAGYKNWDNFKGFMKDYDEVHEGSTLKTYIKQLEQAKVYGNQTVPVSYTHLLPLSYMVQIKQ